MNKQQKIKFLEGVVNGLRAQLARREAAVRADAERACRENAALLAEVNELRREAQVCWCWCCVVCSVCSVVRVLRSVCSVCCVVCALLARCCIFAVLLPPPPPGLALSHRHMPTPLAPL
jgi:hypothetical protein